MKKKHSFSSSSDTEVIIHGYEEYGEAVFSMLEGMFAIALWDIKRKKLFLARDRIGKKPIYYWNNKDKLIFASEIKAIVEYPELKREINFQCLSDYLGLRYSPSNLTMFKGIFKLPPASYAVFYKNNLTIKRYWSFPKFESSISPSESKVSELLSASVKKRLLSDVPIGVFLSGGLDSSTITAYASKNIDNLKTFSVSFPGSTDESKFARIVAEKFNTDHKTLVMDEDIISALPEIVWNFDEPLADPAALPTYELCKQVSKHVKVALSGEGGDEVFGGYHTFNYISKLDSLSKMPAFMGKYLLNPILRGSSAFFRYPKKQMLQLASEIAKNTKTTAENQIKLFYFPFEDSEKKEILNISQKIDFSSPIRKFIKETPKIEERFRNTQEYYFKEWLPNDLLMKGDKMSMAHGLELRMPFLDIDLISYFAKLDNKLKQDRLLFRRAVKNLLPKEILARKKQGFTLPISEWFSNPNFSSRFESQLIDLKKRNLLVNSEYERIVKNPSGFRNDHKLWVLLNFELWSKIYLDKINPKKISL